MDNVKVKVYKKVMNKVAQKQYRAEDFINNRIDETCFQEKLSAEEVIYFRVKCLHFFPSQLFSSKIVP